MECVLYECVDWYNSVYDRELKMAFRTAVNGKMPLTADAVDRQTHALFRICIYNVYTQPHSHASWPPQLGSKEQSKLNTWKLTMLFVPNEQPTTGYDGKPLQAAP